MSTPQPDVWIGLCACGKTCQSVAVAVDGAERELLAGMPRRVLRVPWAEWESVYRPVFMSPCETCQEDLA